LIGIINTGKLNAVVKKVGANYTQYLIERKSLDELKSRWMKLLSDRQVAGILGIGKRMVDNLARAGILKPARGKTVDGHPAWLFEEQYIKSFVSKYRSVDPDYNSSPGDLLSLHDAVKYLSFCKVDMPEIIKLVDERRLKPVLDLGRAGLAAMMFKRADLEKYVEGCKEKRRMNAGMTIQEASKFLGVKDVVAKRWIDRGLLQVSRSAGSGGILKTYIPEINLYKFKEEYLFTEEAAGRLGVTPKTVAEWLRQGKLHARSGPKIDGGGRLLFSKNEIHNLCEILQDSPRQPQ
jgi:transposase